MYILKSQLMKLLHEKYCFFNESDNELHTKVFILKLAYAFNNSTKLVKFFDT